MALIGDLAETKVGDVLSLFARGGRSGILRVRHEAREAQLWFHEGALVHASAGSLLGDDAVLDVFGWESGTLEFTPGDSPAAPNVTRSVDALIEVGGRVGPTLHRVRELIPTDHVVFQPADGPVDPGVRYDIGHNEWRVLRALDGVRSVREVVQATHLARGEVVRILYEMTEAGFLERVDLLKTLRTRMMPPFSHFSLVAPGAETDDVVELDEALDHEWRRAARFAKGIERVSVRTLAGKSLDFHVSFRSGLEHVVQLPRAAFGRLGIREGDEVTIRPTGSRRRAGNA